MRVVVTCGPGSEPIDEVRRITNFSTGELGVILANRLSDAGHDVICFKGIGATTPIPLRNSTHIAFTTNDDLEEKLAAVPEREGVGAVFHAAALGDFKVATVRDSQGNRILSAKIPSRQDFLTLELVPARKVLPELRVLFPNARIVGWKFELDGNREAAVAAAMRQIQDTHVDVCVVNGNAWGTGFGIVVGQSVERSLPDKASLADFLARMVA